MKFYSKVKKLLCDKSAYEMLQQLDKSYEVLKELKEFVATHAPETKSVSIYNTGLIFKYKDNEQYYLYPSFDGVNMENSRGSEEGLALFQKLINVEVE